MNPQTIGLFGTCGGSAWRDPFMAKYADLDLPYFNPQVDNWTSELADVEAWHLANDKLILFPITDETFAAGSLAETGFSVLSALRWNANRFVIIFIAPDVCPKLYEQNAQAAGDSRRARALVKAHLAISSNSNVFVVDNLEQMLEASLNLYAALKFIDAARGNVSDWKRSMSPSMWLQVLSTTGADRTAITTETTG